MGRRHTSLALVLFLKGDAPQVVRCMRNCGCRVHRALLPERVEDAQHEPPPLLAAIRRLRPAARAALQERPAAAAAGHAVRVAPRLRNRKGVGGLEGSSPLARVGAKASGTSISCRLHASGPLCCITLPSGTHPRQHGVVPAHAQEEGKGHQPGGQQQEGGNVLHCSRAWGAKERWLAVATGRVRRSGSALNADQSAWPGSSLRSPAERRHAARTGLQRRPSARGLPQSRPALLLPPLSAMHRSHRRKAGHCPHRRPHAASTPQPPSWVQSPPCASAHPCTACP